MDKGTISTLISAATFLTGLLLPAGPVQAMVLSVGMFAFSGGVTNSLAVKMLFDRIPGLVGSGVIPGRFLEIRSELKKLILTHFFSSTALRKFLADHKETFVWSQYLKKKEGEAGPLGSFVSKQWKKVVAVEFVDSVIDRHLEGLLDSSVGGLLLMMGVDNVKPTVHQFVSSLLVAMEEKAVEVAAKVDVRDLEIELDEDRIVEDVRRNIEELIAAKLDPLDATAVKKLIEDGIRSHLGWLVVWGNVLGGLFGVLARFLG
jgi:uncharacterized membrane protein YheB (UPF0754 family)